MHSLWKGAISFGLIHIPVRLYPASRSRELKFKMLHKQDLSEIRYARICKEEGKEVSWEDIVKGYEYRNGEYVILSEEDFERANLKKTKTIEILDFANEREIDTIYYETPYFLEPEKGSAKAYNLLREALQKSQKVAIGNFVFHHHEHLGAIKPHGDLLILHQLRYESELLHPKELQIPKKQPSSKKELAIALQFIQELSKPFKASYYTDTYTDEIKEMIRRKVKGHKTKKIKKEHEVKSPKIHDLMTLLKASLKQRQKKRSKRAA